MSLSHHWGSTWGFPKGVHFDDRRAVEAALPDTQSPK